MITGVECWQEARRRKRRTWRHRLLRETTFTAFTTFWKWYLPCSIAHEIFGCPVYFLLVILGFIPLNIRLALKIENIPFVNHSHRYIVVVEHWSDKSFMFLFLFQILEEKKKKSNFRLVVTVWTSFPRALLLRSVNHKHFHVSLCSQLVWETRF